MTSTKELHSPFALVAAVACCVWSYSSGGADAQTLTLLPATPVMNRAIGKTIQVTCKSSDISVAAQDLRWYSPRKYFPTESEPNLVKSRASMPRETGGDIPRVYSELNEDSLELSIVNIQASDAGVYSCKGRVGGINGLQNFSLVPFELLSVTAQRQQFLVLGDEFNEIKCSVKGTSATVSWARSEQRLSQAAGKYEVRETGLTVFNPSSEDKGVYICRGASPIDGNVEVAEIQVDIYTRPSITQLPWVKGPRGFGIASGDVVMGCNGTGYPLPRFSWFLGTVSTAGVREINDISFGTRFRPNAANGDLNIIELRLDDSGYYWCQAQNDAGLTKSAAPVQLIVARAPYFSWIQNSTTEPEGGTATIICQSQALPKASLTIRKWGRNSAYVDNIQPDDPRITVTQQDPPLTEEVPQLKGNEIRVTISSLKPSDMSNYTCHASNVADTNETTLELRVNFKPIFLEDSRVVYNWEGNRRNLTCRTNAWPQPQFQWVYLGTPITKSEVYKVYFGWMSSSLEIFVPIVSLGRSLWGTYVCIASNQQGSSQQSIELREAQLPDQPVNLTTVKASATSITLSIGLPVFSGGIPPIFAEVLPQIAGSSEAAVARRFQLDEIHNMEIRDLFQATDYAMRVSIRNERGLGRDASLRVSTLQASKPAQVPIISANTSSVASSFTLIWDSPDNGGLPILEYIIEWRKVGDGANWHSVTVANSVTSYAILGLNKKTTYEVQVLARNSRGTSDKSDVPFTFETASGDDVPTSSQVGTTSSKSAAHTLSYGSLTRACWMLLTLSKAIAMIL